MTDKRESAHYCLKTYIVAYIGLPFVAMVASIILIFIALGQYMSEIGIMVSMGVVLIPTAFFSAWILVKKLPQGFRPRYAPILIHLTISVGLWALNMLVLWMTSLSHSGGIYGQFAITPFGLFNIGFFPATILVTLMSPLFVIFLFPLFYDIILLLFFLLLERKTKDKPQFEKKFLMVIFAVILCCVAVGGVSILMRSQKMLQPNYGFDYGNGYSSVDIEAYDILNKNNKLAKLDEPSIFVINEPDKMPVLDGAEAAYPVYSAFANACYEGIDIVSIPDPDAFKTDDEDLRYQKVTFTNTIYAYERLLDGEVDVFFGAQPSKSQIEMAEKAGKELVMTPIGKEAFVFFVGSNNVMSDISTKQIKDIYSGKVKNWKKINGVDEKIWAFQRPENSGSQTIMQKVMGDVKLAAPLRVEYISGMGGASEKVADYRNYPGAIGYSFRFFLTGMTNEGDGVKMLSVDNVEPNDENIRSGKYPYSVPLYAITLKDNDLETLDGFIEFMQSAQGQELVKETGYVID